MKLYCTYTVQLLSITSQSYQLFYEHDTATVIWKVSNYFYFCKMPVRSLNLRIIQVIIIINGSIINILYKLELVSFLDFYEK